MTVAWRKVWRELIDNKVRTTLVVLSITVGVFALGFVFNLRDEGKGMLRRYGWGEC